MVEDLNIGAGVQVMQRHGIVAENRRIELWLEHRSWFVVDGLRRRSRTWRGRAGGLRWRNLMTGGKRGSPRGSPIASPIVGRESAADRHATGTLIVHRNSHTRE